MPSNATHRVTESPFQDETRFDPEDLIKAIVRGCDQLPEFVRHARFTQVSERRLDGTAFNAIVTQSPHSTNDECWSERLQRRRTGLLPFVDRLLTCVFIRLPGIHYTIEVDAAAGKIAYWEWQAD